MQPIFKLAGTDPEGNARIAFVGYDYRAPHAYRPTPARPHFKRAKGVKRRLFKGHRV